MAKRIYCSGLTFKITFLLVAQLFCISLPARAEWLWDDSDYLKWRFESFVRDKIKDKCDDYSQRNLSFGYQSAYSTNDKTPTIAYQIAVQGSTLSCWENLQRSMENSPVQVSIKKPSKISFFPDVVRGKNPITDSGPSIVFYFPVTKSEMNSFERSQRGGR
jgi:hypothetical protein